MPFLTIKKLKGRASFQDLGRNNAQHLGFSGSGAADEFSYLLANYLLNNKLSNPTIELTLGQLTLVANSSCQLVITGADCQPNIRLNNGKEIIVKNNEIFDLSKGDELNLGIPKNQLHSYIAIRGGFLAKSYLNSVSQTINEYALKLGEAELAVGVQLYFSVNSSVITETANTNPAVLHPANISSEKPISQPEIKDNFHQSEQLFLRFLPSPLWFQLTKKTQQLFLSQPYHITQQSNRMGYRLCGERISEIITFKKKSPALSKPTNYGTIQLPDDGQPIVLMKERQTIGGYPTLGTVIQTDLFRLSQKRPGEKVYFVPTSLEQAQAQLLAFHEKFDG